jgi:very-short-patch-repair endonuclease
MEVASTICSEATGSINVAIICPYRAQVRLLRRWIREERRAATSPFQSTQIEAGTVHQFQGSDADVVIFDLVDGEGRPDLGTLLRDDTGMRLVNVAITRAKGKLIVIADKNWCKRSNIHFSNGLLKDLILGQQTSTVIQVVPPSTEPETDDGTESPIERALLQALREHATLASVETQHVIWDENGRPVSRADFAFPELKYAVYCDGKQWHCRADRWERDWRQRNKLTELGWIFSVFTGRDINKDAGNCAAQVLKTFRSRVGG